MKFVVKVADRYSKRELTISKLYKDRTLSRARVLAQLVRFFSIFRLFSKLPLPICMLFYVTFVCSLVSVHGIRFLSFISVVHQGASNPFANQRSAC